MYYLVDSFQESIKSAHNRFDTAVKAKKKWDRGFVRNNTRGAINYSDIMVGPRNASFADLRSLVMDDRCVMRDLYGKGWPSGQNQHVFKFQ